MKITFHIFYKSYSAVKVTSYWQCTAFQTCEQSVWAKTCSKSIIQTPEQRPWTLFCCLYCCLKQVFAHTSVRNYNIFHIFPVNKNLQLVRNRAKGRISKRVYYKKKKRRITDTSVKKSTRKKPATSFEWSCYLCSFRK